MNSSGQKLQVIGWTFDKLEKIGLIEKYDDRTFYVPNVIRFKRMLKRGHVAGFPIKRKSELFLAKSNGQSIDMTVRNYCRLFDEESGACTYWKERDRVKCAAENYYCRRLRDFNFSYFPKTGRAGKEVAGISNL